MEPTVHVLLRGLPWEAAIEDVRASCAAAQQHPLDIELLYEGRLARPSGMAILAFRGEATAAAAATALQGGFIGERYLEARRLDESETRGLREVSARALQKTSGLTEQAFFGRCRADRPEPPAGQRDFVLLCQEAPTAVARGTFEINDLPAGRVDLLARVVTAALFYSHGVRKQARVWLLLLSHTRAVCCDGATVKGLRPDERSVATALRKALGGKPPPGWSVLDGEDAALGALVGRLMARGDADAVSAARPRLLVLDEEGESLAVLPTAADGEGADPGTVVVIGDHRGFGVEEAATLDRFGAGRVSVGAVPLLASQCVTVLHNAMDNRVSFSSMLRATVGPN